MLFKSARTVYPGYRITRKNETRRWFVYFHSDTSYWNRISTPSRMVIVPLVVRCISLARFISSDLPRWKSAFQSISAIMQWSKTASDALWAWTDGKPRWRLASTCIQRHPIYSGNNIKHDSCSHRTSIRIPEVIFSSTRRAQAWRRLWSISNLHPYDQLSISLEL